MKSATRTVLSAKRTNVLFDGTTTTGWAVGGSATLAVASNALRVTNGAAAFGFVSKTVTCSIGKTYRLLATKVNGNNANQLISAGTTAGDLAASSSAGSLTFVATQQTIFISLWAGSNALANFNDYTDVFLIG